MITLHDTACFGRVGKAEQRRSEYRAPSSRHRAAVGLVEAMQSS